jgi:hypothetical protein
MVNIACERELCSFADVAAVARCRFPTTSQRCTSSKELTACFERSTTYGPYRKIIIGIYTFF